ncbi:magnesium chelatase domain-containing protein [Corynebacterium argentoratense]|uniref:magnesium chelatase domain-containing protein n=1 Tax=Corynebacterium argentoratense TaxID=42817 RepID=UPI002E13588B
MHSGRGENVALTSLSLHPTDLRYIKGWMFMSSSGVIARSCSATLVGVEAHLVEVEVSVGPGLPGIHIVGLGDAAIAESKERVKTASQNSGLEWPRTKIIVSLSPASLRKHGAQCDVAICLAIQSALDKDNDYMAWILADSLVMGEVSLDGTLRPVKGILPALVAPGRLGSLGQSCLTLAQRKQH